MEIAALLPAYNSSKYIKSVIDGIPRDIVSKIIVVDDGSTDDTYEVALALPDTIVVKHEANKGYGGAQKTLYEKAYELGFDATVILHADGQHDPGEIAAVIAPILGDRADVVDVVPFSRVAPSPRDDHTPAADVTVARGSTAILAARK